MDGNNFRNKTDAAELDWIRHKSTKNFVYQHHSCIVMAKTSQIDLDASYSTRSKYFSDWAIGRVQTNLTYLSLLKTERNLIFDN
jgi:hypothetical protein